MSVDIDTKDEFEGDPVLYRVKLFFEWGDSADETAVEFDLEVDGVIDDRALFITDLVAAYSGVAEIVEERKIINLEQYKYATLELVSELASTDHVGMVVH